MPRSPVLVALVMTCTLSLHAQTPPSPQVSPSSPQHTGRTLTLREAEALALKNNPQITIGKLQALISQQTIRETRSALLPNAYLSVTAVDAHDNSRISAGALNNPIIFPRAATGVTVSQLITDFGRTNNLLASSENRSRAQEDLAKATAAQITLAVDQAFFNALETKALVAVAQQTQSTRQTFVDKIQALTNAKLKSDLDLSFANVDLARGKLLLLEARNNYESALNSLSAILGYQDQQDFQPVEESKEVTPPAPDVSALGAAGIAPVRDSRLPNWYGAVGANINIPLFGGFLFDARAKTADLQTEVNRQKLTDLRNNVARDVRNAWQDTNRGFERLSVTRQLREQASLAFDLAQARYDLGLSSIVEFSQADLQKTEADIAATDAECQYRLTQIVLAFTISAPK
jgi:outer membrane protein